MTQEEKLVIVTEVFNRLSIKNVLIDAFQKAQLEKKMECVVDDRFTGFSYKISVEKV